MNRFIKYALDVHGTIRSVEEVKPQIQYICPACHSVLVPKISPSERKPHFEHINSEICECGYERSLQLLAIKIIAKNGFIRVPAGNDGFQLNHQELFPVLDLEVKSIQLSSVLENVVPHIILELKDGRLLNLDILVTSARDEEKVKTLRQTKVSTLEFDLTYYKYQIEEDDFENRLLKQTLDKKWLYYAEEESVTKALLELVEPKQNYFSGDFSYVKFCPLKTKASIKGSLNLVEEKTCQNCPFMLKSRKTNSNTSQKPNCLGHLKGIEDVSAKNIHEFISHIEVKEDYLRDDKNIKTQATTICNLWQANPFTRPLRVVNNLSNRVFEIIVDPMMTLLKYGEVYGINVMENAKSADVVYFHSREVWTLYDESN